MKIAIGGMQKTEMQKTIQMAYPKAETVITTDMKAVPMLKNGEADYYFGACESGGGAAISILIGLLGYSKCCTVCRNGGRPDKKEIEKYVRDGKVCFGMAVSNIDGTVPMLLAVLLEHEKSEREKR